MVALLIPMVMPQTQIQTKEQNVQGQFTTAEVTHLLKAIHMEGMCYMDNHIAMRLAGTEGVIREWQDTVTRPNLSRLMELAREMGVPLPFAKPLEERETELKTKLTGPAVEGTLTEGEAIGRILLDAEQMTTFYTTSFNLSTNPKMSEVFRRNLNTIMEQRPRLLQSYRGTKEFLQPPMVQKVQLTGVLALGVQPKTGRNL